MSNELKLFQIAQEVTDKVLGPGTYKKMNKFDPSKGETHQRDSVGCFHQLEHIDEPPFRYRCKLCGKKLKIASGVYPPKKKL